jgi:hypothetical protein
MMWLLISILIAAYLIAMRKEIIIWLKLMKEKIK